MITDKEIIRKGREINARFTNLEAYNLELARWAYEKGYDQAVKEDNMANWIKPKFKVGDKVTIGHSGDCRTIVEVSSSYRLDDDGTANCVWHPHELNNYKEKPLKVGDRVYLNKTSYTGKILAIFKNDVWVCRDDSGRVSTYGLDDLERV